MFVAGGLRQIVDAMGTLRMPSPCSVGQLGQIVDGASHRPLASDLVEAPRQELPEASGLLDLSEHRLDDLLAQPVAATPAGALELPCHGGLARPFRPLSRTRRMQQKPITRNNVGSIRKFPPDRRETWASDLSRCDPHHRSGNPAAVTCVKQVLSADD